MKKREEMKMNDNKYKLEDILPIPENLTKEQIDKNLSNIWKNGSEEFMKQLELMRDDEWPTPVKEKEMVDHPEHYNQNGYECIDVMVAIYGKEWVIQWCAMTAFKYLFRCKHKEKFNEDLSKAYWYLNWIEQNKDK